MSIASAAPRTINPARARAWSAQAQLAAANIPPAPANHLIPGLMGLALARQHINIPVPAPDTPVAPAPPATANTPLVNALLATTGMPPPEHASQTLPSVR